jgi:hypothetical protein
MPPRWVEEDDNPPLVILSMRQKAILVFSCFFVVMCLVAYSDVPYYVEAVQNPVQGTLPQKEPPIDQETPGEVDVLPYVEIDGLGIVNFTPAHASILVRRVLRQAWQRGGVMSVRLHWP